MQNKRAARRRTIEAVSISNLTTLFHFETIAKEAMLVDASSTGFLIHVNRKEILPEHLRQNLSLENIEGEPVMLLIDQMDLEINGHIARTRYIGKGIFEIAVDFSEDAPEYWRECLFDLLPHSQDFEDEEFDVERIS